MSKAISKKAVERRRRTRPAPSSARAASAGAVKGAKQIKASEPALENVTHARKSLDTPVTRRKKQEVFEDRCYQCNKDLKNEDKALLVEEENGRLFCTEDCISGFFGPEIARLEKEYFKYLKDSDLAGEQREKYAHLRWITLEEPDEVWREKTLAGDYRYTLISEFRPNDKPIWCVCLCLFLRGEPSFLYLAFPTKNAAMVNLYRRGERMQWVKSDSNAISDSAGALHKANADKDRPQASQGNALVPLNAPVIDGLASAWTEEETLRAMAESQRRTDDIPLEDFELYNRCVEDTLEEPDELWHVSTAPVDGLKIFHFIRHYPDEKPGIWYVIVARETEDDEQIEIMDAFPSRDPGFVEQYRRGSQELDKAKQLTQNRVVH